MCVLKKKLWMSSPHYEPFSVLETFAGGPSASSSSLFGATGAARKTGYIESSEMFENEDAAAENM